MEVESQAVGPSVQEHTFQEIVLVIALGRADSECVQAEGKSALNEPIEHMSHLSGTVASVLLVLLILSKRVLLPLLENGLQIEKPGLFNKSVHASHVPGLLAVYRQPSVPDTT